MPHTPAKRRMHRRLIPLAVLYLAACAAGKFLIDRTDLPDIAVYIIAVLLSLPLVFSIFVIGRYVVEEDDEYIRMLVVRHMVTATGMTLVTATVWGLLELYADAPALPIYYILVIWCAGFAFSQIQSRFSA